MLHLRGLMLQGSCVGADLSQYLDFHCEQPLTSVLFTCVYEHTKPAHNNCTVNFHQQFIWWMSLNQFWMYSKPWLFSFLFPNIWETKAVYLECKKLRICMFFLLPQSQAIASTNQTMVILSSYVFKSAPFCIGYLNVQCQTLGVPQYFFLSFEYLM